MRSISFSTAPARIGARGTRAFARAPRLPDHRRIDGPTFQTFQCIAGRRNRMRPFNKRAVQASAESAISFFLVDVGELVAALSIPLSATGQRGTTNEQNTAEGLTWAT